MTDYEKAYCPHYSPPGPISSHCAGRNRLRAGMRLFQLARLNTRVGTLALRGRWLTSSEVAAGYNQVAATYETAWQRHLRPVTDALLQRLPTGLPGVILDLGAGTGYASRLLALKNPAAKIIAVDISEAMLEQTRANAPANLQTAVSDMLAFAQSQPVSSVRMIVSTWALGYSHPARLFRACAELLEPGARFAFIVNYADTLEPVFRSFKKCMVAFPDRVRLAAWPRFPKDWRFIESQLRRSGFDIEWHEEGFHPITPPKGPLLSWLRQTGVLAGFDEMLDFSGPVAEFFEGEIAPGRDHIRHHFASVIARKP